jgi:hypothetical protein
MKIPDWVNSFLSKSVNELPEFSIKDFKKVVENIKHGNKHSKEKDIKKLLSMEGLLNHHTDKETRRIVMASCEKFEFDHEHHTAKKLASVNYDVVLVPKGYFRRDNKKFDVFLCRGHIFLESDLKCINTSNPDTVADRIIEGSEQSSRIVMDVVSKISKNNLIDGLRSGSVRNDELLEIMLFYGSGFYCLPKTQILSKNIFKVIK